MLEGEKIEEFDFDQEYKNQVNEANRFINLKYFKQFITGNFFVNCQGNFLFFLKKSLHIDIPRQFQYTGSVFLLKKSYHRK